MTVDNSLHNFLLIKEKREDEKQRWATERHKNRLVRGRRREANMSDHEKNKQVRSRKSEKHQDEQYNYHWIRRLTCPSVLLGNPASSYFEEK